jgi:hypothetical protein
VKTKTWQESCLWAIAASAVNYREKKIKNFLLPFSGPLTFCGKTPPLYPKGQPWVIDSPRLLKSLPRFIV